MDRGTLKYTGYWFIEYEDLWWGDNRIEEIKREASIDQSQLNVVAFAYKEGDVVQFYIKDGKAFIVNLRDTNISQQPKDDAEAVALEQYDQSVGDDGLFPNHTDKDIWIAGFKAGYIYSKYNT